MGCKIDGRKIFIEGCKKAGIFPNLPLGFDEKYHFFIKDVTLCGIKKFNFASYRVVFPWDVRENVICLECILKFAKILFSLIKENKDLEVGDV